MINSYSIKKIKNNEVLVLYLDYSYEFSSFDDIKIISNIKDFINKRNIKFNGNKVILMVGSLMLGTLILNTNNLYDKNYDSKEPYTYVSKVTLNNYDNLNKLKSISKIDTKKKVVNTIKVKKINNTVKKINSKNTNKVTANKRINSSKKTSTIKKATNNKITTKKVTTKTNKKKANNTTSKKETNNDIKVTIYRNSGKIITLSLEEYLIGVVGAEMPASFNIEALKAQAIAARTYTLKSIKKNKKITDTTSTQVYKDNNELKKMWGSSFNTYYQKVKSAVNSTKGLYITYNGDYIDAVFFSTSNGYTEDPINVWGYNIPYLKIKDSPLDKNTSAYLRTKEFTYDEFSKILGFTINKETTISITKNKSNRVSTIKINNKTYTGVDFRELLNLRSTDFDLELENNKIVITTRGYGHGVGLSQYGSNELAKSGYTYDKIIKYYYTGVSINKLK